MVLDSGRVVAALLSLARLDGTVPENIVQSSQRNFAVALPKMRCQGNFLAFAGFAHANLKLAYIAGFQLMSVMQNC